MKQKLILKYENSYNGKSDIQPEDKKSKDILNHLRLIRKMTESYKNPIFEIIDELQKAKNESRALYKFQVLIYLILSPRANNNALYSALITFKSIGFNPEKLVTFSELELFMLLPSISLGKQKAGYIKKMCKEILENYNGDPPEVYELVTNLPGIGPLMADIYFNMISESEKYLSISGHVQRVANRLNWVSTSSFKVTKKELENLLPNNFWGDLNILIDSFGQTVCKKTDPLCYSCLLKDSCAAKLNGIIGKEKFKRSKWYKEENKVEGVNESRVIKLKTKSEKFDVEDNSLKNIVKKKKNN